MTTASWVICNAFLHQCPPQKRSSLLKYVAVEERQAIEALGKTYRDPTKPAESLKSQLQRIHFSWFTPHLRNLPEREVKFFLSALSEPQAAGLKKGLRFSGNLVHLSKNGETYLQGVLLKQVVGSGVNLFPIGCLPDSPLNALLEIEVVDLQTLISFLGLHDLAVEMRHIIETSKLKKIFDILPPQQLKYVKILMQSREPIAFTRMGLSNWKGEAESLKLLIEQRGLNRLSKAIYGQLPSFIWHLVHKFDIDRGMAIQKLCTPMENISSAKLLIAQVLELLSFMRNTHE